MLNLAKKLGSYPFKTSRKIMEKTARELYESLSKVFVSSGIGPLDFSDLEKLYNKAENTDETFWVIEKGDLYLGVSCNQFKYVSQVGDAIKFTDNLSATEIRNILKMMFSSIGDEFNNTLITEHVFSDLS